MSTDADVARCLLGTWPSQVGSWGEDGITAYIYELKARGIGPADALIAIRTFDPNADYPPSAAKLAQQARRDPSQPSFEETMTLICGPGGVLATRTSHRMPPAEDRNYWLPGEREGLDEAAMWEKARGLHPTVAGFIRHQGGMREMQRWQHECSHPQYGAKHRAELQEAFAEFLEHGSRREVAVLVSGGGREGLKALNPVSALGMGRPELGLPPIYALEETAVSPSREAEVTASASTAVAIERRGQ